MLKNLALWLIFAAFCFTNSKASSHEVNSEGMIELADRIYIEADPKSEETTRLKKKYTQQRRRITQRFARGKILEITLKQLCSDTPIDQ